MLQYLVPGVKIAVTAEWTARADHDVFYNTIISTSHTQERAYNAKVWHPKGWKRTATFKTLHQVHYHPLLSAGSGFGSRSHRATYDMIRDTYRATTGSGSSYQDCKCLAAVVHGGVPYRRLDHRPCHLTWVVLDKHIGPVSTKAAHSAHKRTNSSLSFHSENSPENFPTLVRELSRGRSG